MWRPEEMSILLSEKAMYTLYTMFIMCYKSPEKHLEGNTKQFLGSKTVGRGYLVNKDQFTFCF